MRFNKASDGKANVRPQVNSGLALAVVSLSVFSLVASQLASPVMAEDAKAPRQIAVSIPGLGEAKIVVTPKPPGDKGAQEKAKGKPDSGRTALSKPLISSGLAPGESISVKLPRNMDEFIDDMDQVGKQVSRTAQSGVTEVSRLMHWISVYFKQFTHQSSLTPGAYPYIEVPSQPVHTSPSSPAKLFFTKEGRLKTIVNQ